MRGNTHVALVPSGRKRCPCLTRKCDASQTWLTTKTPASIKTSDLGKRRLVKRETCQMAVKRRKLRLLKIRAVNFLPLPPSRKPQVITMILPYWAPGKHVFAGRTKPGLAITRLINQPEFWGSLRFGRSSNPSLSLARSRH